MLSVLERRRVCLIGSDRGSSSLGCGWLCLGEVRFDRSGGEEEESAEDGLGNEGVAEEHPGGLVLRKAGPQSLGKAAPRFDVKWIEGPAQGVGKEVEDEGRGHRAEEDLAGLGIFEIAGEEDHGGESGEGDEELGAPAIALHRTGERVGRDQARAGRMMPWTPNRAIPQKKRAPRGWRLPRCSGLREPRIRAIPRTMTKIINGSARCIALRLGGFEEISSFGIGPVGRLKFV